MKFMDTADDFHPYECDGPGKCIHCDRKITYIKSEEDDTPKIDHDPETCELCDSTNMTQQ